jgi:DNA invertase Pin-like site-specific DNA recombinase
MSGSSHLRPQYQKLIEDARKGLFEVVLAESLDRVTRDQEHVAHLYKNLTPKVGAPHWPDFLHSQRPTND